MPVTNDTLRLIGDIRIQVDRHVDEATHDLVERWAEAWQTLSLEWAKAWRVVRLAMEADERPTRTQLLRAEQVQRALLASHEALRELSAYAGVRVAQPVDVVSELGANAQLDLIQSQLPEGEAATQLRGSVTRVDKAQIQAIVKRTTQNITSASAALSDYGMAAIRAELVRGISIGLNPREVARRIWSDLQATETLNRAFNLTLNRAMVIARTEMLDAHRVAAEVGQNANADVLRGWMWVAQLDTRTCPSCWGQHGSMHDLSESGPYDHQQGRCARVPIVKPWTQLGYIAPELPSLIPEAEAVFAGLSPVEQVAIMGQERLAMLNQGRMSWSELSQRRTTPGWRDSFVVRPLRSVRKSRLRVV